MPQIILKRLDGTEEVMSSASNEKTLPGVIYEAINGYPRAGKLHYPLEFGGSEKYAHKYLGDCRAFDRVDLDLPVYQERRA